MHVEVPQEQIESFCRKWKIREFALFGSVLRDDFRPDSDVDVLVSFDPEARYSLFDLVEMEEELTELYGRKVDLVLKSSVVNPFIKRHIANHHRVLYAA